MNVLTLSPWKNFWWSLINIDQFSFTFMINHPDEEERPLK